jgi:signal transduction histidine kinase
MDAETRSKLFTMYFSTKGAFGTGLGLLVSHKVATEHGGTIAVRSEPGQGSTFTVRLPLAGAPERTV